MDAGPVLVSIGPVSIVLISMTGDTRPRVEDDLLDISPGNGDGAVPPQCRRRCSPALRERIGLLLITLSGR